jgi:HD superfamily phosphohydrolase
LETTDKDVLCITFAGLLHGIGYGPFSHINFAKHFKVKLRRNVKWKNPITEKRTREKQQGEMEDWRNREWRIGEILHTMAVEILLDPPSLRVT